MSQVQPERFGRAWIWVLLVIALGTALRFYRVDHQSLWSDENFSVSVSSGSFAALMESLREDFLSPPLHYFGLFGLFSVVEVGSFAPRLMCALIGAAAVPVLYFAGRTCFGHRVGLLAALLLAVSQLGVAYAQEVRPYGQVVLFASCALLFFARTIRFGSLSAWGGFVISAVLCLYTHYFSFFLVAPLFIWALLDRGLVPLRWAVLGCVAGVCSYVPWLLTGVVEAALQSSRPTADHPPWFRVYGNTPFLTLNQYANGFVSGLFSRAPTCTFFLGALFFGAVALAAAWPGHVRFTARLDAPMPCVVGGVLVGVVSLMAAEARSGLALAVLLLLRAVLQVGRLAAMSGTVRDGVFAGFAIAAAAAIAWSGHTGPSWIWSSVTGFVLGGVLVRRFSATAPVETDAAGERRITLLAALGAVLPVALPMGLAVAVGTRYEVRYTLAALPAFCVLVARGCTRLEPALVRRFVVVFCVAYSLVALRGYYTVPYKENWRDALAVVAAGYQPDDGLIVAPAKSTMPRSWFIYGYDALQPNVDLIPPEQVADEVPRRQRVWVVSYRRVGRAAKKSRAVVELVRASHDETRREDFTGMDVRLFERR